jgi:hypothetical protein
MEHKVPTRPRLLYLALCRKCLYVEVSATTILNAVQTLLHATYTNLSSTQRTYTECMNYT